MPLPVNLSEFESAARERLPRMVFDYFAGGANDEITLRANRSAFDTTFLRPRVLVDVSHRDLSTTLLGQKIDFPVIIAPMGFQAMAHPDGELASCRAAGSSGTMFVASTMSNHRMEDIAKAATGPIWFQLYVYRDRAVTRDLVQRAEAVGFTALQVTTDLPVLGRREADIRNGFHLPNDLRIRNLEEVGYSQLPPDAPTDSRVALYTSAMLDPSLTWNDIDWLRSITRLPVIVKGILRGDDAKRAIEHGASGVVVSNHGGRQLDTASATFDALSEVAETLAGSGEVLIDGGIRRGTDVLKAIARGAKAVMIGRPVLWGLALDGEDGVRRVLQLIRTEFDHAMALCGCANVGAITRDMLR